MTAVYNAANEEAAAAFLDGTDPVFPAIVRTIGDVLADARPVGRGTRYRGRVLDAQRWARATVPAASSQRRLCPPDDVPVS